MSVYLHDIPLSEAKQRFQQAIQAAGRWCMLGIEAIPLDENAAGRTLAEAVWARISSPHYHASAMDGFALRSEDTSTAMPTAPVVLSLGDSGQLRRHRGRLTRLGRCSRAHRTGRGAR